jgi:hypothetical protein
MKWSSITSARLLAGAGPSVVLGVAALLFWLHIGAAGCSSDPDSGEFGADCASDDECNGDLVCFAFTNGSQCTLPCPANPDDCPEGSSGCNDKKVCKTK